MSPTFALIILLLVLLFLIVLSISVVISFILRVPYVPTPYRTVRSMIDLAKPTSEDIVLDLGCGDGRLLHEVYRMTHAQCRGYELSLLPYLMAVFSGFFRGSRATVLYQDFFGASLSDATVIFTYLTPRVMQRLEKKLLSESRSLPLRVISHGFPLPNQTPTEVVVVGQGSLSARIYRYEFPIS